MANNSKTTSAAKPATTRSTAARFPPAALRDARRNAGEDTNALDRIESNITVTAFRDLNPFCGPTVARRIPLAVHVPASVQTQLAALTQTLPASLAVRHQ
jgi:hypothetical protein